MFFRRSSSPSGAPEYLICGLGNPGPKYEMTRHNAGFLYLDRLADQLNVRVTKLKFKALVGDAELNGVRCLLMKPQTFMNQSGEAVRDAAAFYKIPAEKILVVFDDISLDPGVLRIRRKGSDGGHNGIKSILYHLGKDTFPRIKIGVGKKPHPDYDLADFVLSRFPAEAQKPLADAIDRAVEATPLIVTGQIDQAMNRYNG